MALCPDFRQKNRQRFRKVFSIFVIMENPSTPYSSDHNMVQEAGSNGTDGIPDPGFEGFHEMAEILLGFLRSSCQGKWAPEPIGRRFGRILKSLFAIGRDMGYSLP